MSPAFSPRLVLTEGQYIQSFTALVTRLLKRNWNYRLARYVFAAQGESWKHGGELLLGGEGEGRSSKTNARAEY